MFDSNVKFKKSWRKYQQKILDNLNQYLQDNHLHIVAPPGAGKTILGLEVAIRLNQPTLILVPTIAIQTQWVLRFYENFLPERSTVDWISKDVRQPKLLTIATYQGLHAACNNLKEKNENLEEEQDNEEQLFIEKTDNFNTNNILKALKVKGIKTLIVDEAHHLKNEWWQTLFKVKENLNPVLIGLTATPPYDVNITEWQRYNNLLGNIDAEITTPELVIEGDLCPHQDYVFFSMPTAAELLEITTYRNNVDGVFKHLSTDSLLIEAFETLIFWQQPEEHIEWICNDIPTYSAILIFLHANKISISETHLALFNAKVIEIPALDVEWMTILLDFYLFKGKEHFIKFKTHQHNIEVLLKQKNILDKKQINFSSNKEIVNTLNASLSKLNSIKSIVDFEYQQLGEKLKMVILSDFIRKEILLNKNEQETKLNKMGVMPIFEKLRRENRNELKIGVLTGSIVIIPQSMVALFTEKVSPDIQTKLTISKLPIDESYSQINVNESIRHQIVHIITQLFEEGQIQVLIGTKSLLGEGWDAPSINTLILASFVGSFVSSNQMRGRAIRIEHGNENKTGNIWHLACIDPTEQHGGQDIVMLKRRLSSFVGVSFDEDPVIENGIARLRLPENLFTVEGTVEKNELNFSYAKDRENLKKRWAMALQKGINLVEEIKQSFPKEQNYQQEKTLYFSKTLAYLLATLTSGLIYFLGESFEYLIRISDKSTLLTFLYVIGIFTTLFFGRLFYQYISLYLKYRDIDKDFRRVAEVTLRALTNCGAINTPYRLLSIHISKYKDGTLFCHLEGGTSVEKSIFINAFSEILMPIQNPRYVLIRKSQLVFLNQQDYHAVPEVIGKNKAFAEYFEKEWRSHIGRCSLVYTRTLEGRKVLLLARIKSLSAQFQENSERVNKWK